MIQTNHILMRLAQPGDAAWMYDMRNNDPRQLLSPLPGTVADQRKYIVKSRADDSEDFWVISAAGDHTPIGVVRWTELDRASHMNWQSLIVSPEAPPAIGIDVMVTTYARCFLDLQRPLLGKWRVPHWNTSMQEIHKKMGFAKVVDSDPLHLWYAVTREWFDDAFDKWHTRGFGHIR